MILTILPGLGLLLRNDRLRPGDIAQGQEHGARRESLSSVGYVSQRRWKKYPRNSLRRKRLRHMIRKEES